MHTQTPFKRFAAAAIALTALGWAAAAHAQISISQETVMAGGGFPLVISTPGSYKLTGNLQVSAGAPGIEIAATGVTLDLNGFMVTSPGTCTHDPSTYNVNCHNAANTEVGIKSSVGGAVIMNGTVRGFHIGVWHYGGDHLERLLVSHNHTGVRSLSSILGRTLIRDVRAEMNRDDGFDVSDTLIQGSSANRNGGDGFKLNRSTVHESAAYFNKGTGMSGNTHSATSRSDAYGNVSENINASVKSMGGNRNGDAAY